MQARVRYDEHMSARYSTLVILSLLSAQLGAFDEGDGWFAGVYPLQLAQQATVADKDAAANIARAATGGRVLAVDDGTDGDRPVYNVKILLPDGHIRVVVVDGTSGDIL